MSEAQEVEKRIQEKGLNAPRLTPADIDRVIVSQTYTVMPSGKVMVCELTLANGFTVRGEAATVSKENFDEEIGKRVSRERAWNKIWELEGYLLQEKLAQSTRSQSPLSEGAQAAIEGLLIALSNGDKEGLFEKMRVRFQSRGVPPHEQVAIFAAMSWNWDLND